MNLVLNTGYVKWSKQILEDGDPIDGLTRTGLKITVLPNTQVRRGEVRKTQGSARRPKECDGGRNH